MQSELNFGVIDSPLAGMRLYLSGSFRPDFKFKRDLAKYLEHDFGAKMMSESGSAGLLGLSKDTCAIVVDGQLEEKDQYKLEALDFDGYCIPVLTWDELKDILSGKREAHLAAPSKNLSITYDKLFHLRFSPITHLEGEGFAHPLGMKEVYVDKDIPGLYLLEQALGNIGAYTSVSFDPKKTDYCLLTRQCIERLRGGQKDAYIRGIEQRYNTSSEVKFTCKFLLEDELVGWLERRAREIGDEVSLDYITRYIRGRQTTPL